MSTLFAFDGMSIGYDGSKFQSATFHNNQLIYGIDFLHANVSSEIENEYCQNYDYYGNCYNYYTETEDISLSINIFIPRIGYKMPGRSSGKISTYNQIEAYLVFPLVSIDVGEGGETDEMVEVIEDIVDVMGFRISKNISYNFNEQLSIIAHVGFNLTIGDIDNDIVDGAIGGRLGMTYTQLSLKFNL
ncbi:MAG: hypothetical protein HN820_06180 [Candidatus Marinimicrobia bacterium]|nr:hypothetical protein [Candidatus Neomarinimicrobiota bacterium]